MKLQRAAAAAVVSSVVIAAGTGCETKSWIDPSEVGRYERTPLVVPILDKLVVGVEADEVQFAGAREVTAEDLEPNSRDYRVGPNDLLQVTIQDLQGAGTINNETKRVSESGKISLPYLNQVSVDGMTEAEIEDAVAQAYVDQGILVKRGIVGVSVIESQNRIYSVSGAISNPGPYPLLRGDLRLLEAITNARGATSELGIDYVYIIRRKHTNGAGGTDNNATPAVPPGEPGRDPLAPSSRAPVAQPLAPMFAMIQTQPAPQTPEEARAAAERLANELQSARAAQPGTPTDPMTPPPAAGVAIPGDNVRDRVIQIEGAGAQPAMPGDQPTITTIPPADAAATTTPADPNAPFEFTAPAEPTDQEVIKVPFTQLKRGELKYNIVVRAGDMIVLPFPPFGYYYMGGHVARTGAYSLNGPRVTLKQAVMSAGMLDQLAIPARTDVVRRIGPNQEVFVRVDLERIFTGLEPDIFLKPDDSVMVGTNLGASFAAALRNAFRVTYGFGFLYDRNYAPSNNNQ